MTASSPVVKKIVPYPFAASLELATVKRAVEVVRLTPSGFLADLKGAMVSVGEHYQAVLPLPASSGFVNSSVRVMKTYDRSMDPKQHVVTRMAEFHFEALTEDHKKHILSFLSAIGQK